MFWDWNKISEKSQANVLFFYLLRFINLTTIFPLLQFEWNIC